MRETVKRCEEGFVILLIYLEIEKLKQVILYIYFLDVKM